MKKVKGVKSALLTSVVSLFLCVTMLVGTTFAWFTDSVTSANNIIKSGTLDVKLEYSVLENGAWTDYAEVTNTTDIFGYDKWEPGHVAIAKFRISNVGTLALKYTLSADVYSEIAGKNVNGEEFLLSDYLYTQIVDVDATREEILASTEGNRFKAPVQGQIENDLVISSANILEKDAVVETALAIWMPTSVGNEANYREVQPSITFGINLIATQAAFEGDSFGTDYDVNAAYPIIAWGSADINGATNYSIDLIKANGGKAGSADVPASALAGDVKNVNILVVETAVPSGFVVASDDQARTFEITAEGLKENNTDLIKVQLTVGAGLTGVKLYHNATEIDATYNADLGTLIFFTDSFSPFTVVYDAVAVEEDDSELESDVPVAELTDADQYENTELGWTGWGGYNPSNSDQQLDSVYLFKAPHDSTTVKECLYKDWYCDYYVMLDSETASVLPEGAITLGGNYGGYGWVGFDNPEVNTNEYIPLLASAIGRDQNASWTYEAVCGLVQEFWCGVGVADSNLVPTDAKFVVQLRLTNPDNTSEYFVCNEVVYDFATGDSVITNYQAQ